jgi:type III secretory pathway component EscV
VRNSVRVMKPLASKTLFGFGSGDRDPFEAKLLSAPSNLWTEEHLEELYGCEFMKSSFDHNFQKMASEFSHPRRYLPPNEEIIKRFCNECHDLQMMTTTIAAQSEKVKQIQQQKYESFIQNQFIFYSKTYPDSKQLIALEFSQLPISFKSRSRDELMSQLSRLKTFQDAIVHKMVQDSIRDQNKYFSSFNNIQKIADEGNFYLKKVSDLRNKIAKLKSGMVQQNLEITRAFNSQLKKKKALYILQKIEKKYGSVIKYVVNGLNNIPLKNLKDIYQVFVVTQINVREDRLKYRALVFLKKLEDGVENNLTKLRKKLRNLLYENIRHVSQKYTESKAE